jgi:hypothetical protein
MTLIHRILGALIPMLLLAAQSQATTWYVHQGGLGDATSIQAGVDLATTGDTVLVAPGTYTDTVHVWIEGEEKVANVHLTKEICLVAEGDTSNTAILGPGSDVAVFVEGVEATDSSRGSASARRSPSFSAPTQSPKRPSCLCSPPRWRVSGWGFVARTQ